MSALTRDEWEALCDGCGKCCLVKLTDSDTGDLYYTDVACRLLDQHSCRCTDYGRRLQEVSECIQISIKRKEVFAWLPSTCAYRLRWYGQDLPDWHPLLSGDANSVHKAGVSVQNKTVTAEQVGDIRDRVVLWEE